MRKLGITILLLGITIFAFYYIHDIVLDKKSQEDINDYINETSIVTKEEHELPEGPVQENPKKSTSINYTAVLEIPKINLKRGVVDNTSGFKSITYAISVDNSSNYPNENGNFILYAHSGRNYNAYFTNLDKMNIDDDVFVYYNGTKYNYIIKEKTEIPKKGKANIST